MPIPKPRSGESKDDFMSRCMGNDTMNSDFPDQDQRAAVCNTAWEDRNKSAEDDGEFRRAWATLDIKAVSEDERIVEGVASTPEPDRSGDVVEPMGAQYKLPMPLLWQHNAREPVGNVIEVSRSRSKITFKARLPKIEEPGRLKDRVDEAWQSIKHGLVRGVSVGFKPLEYSMMDEGGIHFVKWLWAELSLVTIPANEAATITRVKTLDTAVLTALGQEPTAAQGDPPGDSGTKKRTLSLKGKTMSRTIAESISAYEAKRAALAARMDDIMTKSAESGATLDPEQAEEYDGLKDELKAIDDHLVRLKDLETAKAASAASVAKVGNLEEGSNARAGVVVKVEEKLEKGIEFARFAMCVAAGRGNLMQSFEIAKTRYPHSDGIITALKAAVAAGTTSHATWASPLVETYQRFVGDFVEFLRPQTLIGKFGQGGIPSLRRVPFNINIVTQTSGGAGYWVGQGAPKPLTKFDFSSVNLGFAKVANIAILTEELIRFSNPSAEALVRDQLAAALVARLDTDFVDPAKAAVANVSPASITNGITPIASSGNTPADIRADVRALMSAYITANITPNTGVWLMSATTALGLSTLTNALTGQAEFPGLTMNGGTFMGLPVIVSEYVPTSSDGKLVILVNASDIWLADDGQVTIDASREASLEMLDNPTNNSATPTPTTMVSMFQTNSVALRAERFINWQLRRAEAVQVLGYAQWGE
jgi:HK97 family phage prohead protease